MKSDAGFYSDVQQGRALPSHMAPQPPSVHTPGSSSPGETKNEEQAVATGMLARPGSIITVYWTTGMVHVHQAVGVCSAWPNDCKLTQSRLSIQHPLRVAERTLTVLRGLPHTTWVVLSHTVLAHRNWPNLSTIEWMVSWSLCVCACVQDCIQKIDGGEGD